MPERNERLRLLGEVEELLRTAPTPHGIGLHGLDHLSWLGSLGAVIRKWDPNKSVTLLAAQFDLHSSDPGRFINGFRTLIALLHEARADLRFDSGLTSVAIASGQVFDYFEEIRGKIEMAHADILFVDSYLDAGFVASYLPHVKTTVKVRLLGRYGMAGLVPAARLFAQQSGLDIGVRSEPSLHDRYFFVDGLTCFQSGASFKDGAKKSPTVITQVSDAFQAMLQTYEALWASAKVEL